MLPFHIGFPVLFEEMSEGSQLEVDQVIAFHSPSVARASEEQVQTFNFF